MATKDISDLQVVQAFDAATGIAGVFADSILEERTRQPAKVCYGAMERAYRHGLIECGVTLRSGWLTPKGEALLEQREPTGEPGP